MSSSTWFRGHWRVASTATGFESIFITLRFLAFINELMKHFSGS